MPQSCTSTPKSAYIHVPFCSRRCGYCNFTLVTGRDDLIDAYLDALEQELTLTLDSPRSVETIFVGGGTPTYLPPRALRRFLELVTYWFKLPQNSEFSIEANPLDCTPDLIRLLQDFGVGRISLGGQSFSDRKLVALERDHTGHQLREALERCCQAIPQTSLDLIFASPGERLEEWDQDLSCALNYPIQHLSTYGLTVERGSAFYGRVLRDVLSEVDSDTQLAMYELSIAKLLAAGWEHYEVSNFAHRGQRCRHNENYWLGNPWWAFGPGAASFLPAHNGTMTRRVNHRSTTTYIQRIRRGESAVAEHEELSREQCLRERLVFGLRQRAGVSLTTLSEDWGRPVRPLFEPSLTRFIDQGWLQLNEQTQQLSLTHQGLLISDSLWPDLL